jgi:hypothetical protein
MNSIFVAHLTLLNSILLLHVWVVGHWHSHTHRGHSLHLQLLIEVLLLLLLKGLHSHLLLNLHLRLLDHVLVHRHSLVTSHLLTISHGLTWLHLIGRRLYKHCPMLVLTHILLRLDSLLIALCIWSLLRLTIWYLLLHL